MVQKLKSKQLFPKIEELVKTVLHMSFTELDKTFGYKEVKSFRCLVE